ncbi:translation initiation factor 2 [Streptomyces aidingensis]|uniref:translation initiation factor 2 n=1 Tax=Streptomyces aidingensis TaxID=910347 RepID=UPI001FE976CB|nr:translation initiation factor 2 [Streptomyces aidingensis]
MPSGLDPAFLHAPDGTVLATRYALAHPSQVTRLAALSPQAAAHATVVGDATLDRILASRSRRDRYRATLGTGDRTLVVLASSWGPESLFQRCPGLAAELAAALPHDAWQFALLLHPNERSRLGSFELEEHLAPARDAGLILAEPYQEWAALLVAADTVITDHGSTALYAAALDLPVIAACHGGRELLPGTPMADLLARSPRWEGPGSLPDALAAHRPRENADIADGAFAQQGHALKLLRQEIYRLLQLPPPPLPAIPRLLPPPSAAPRTPTAFAVRARPEGQQVYVERFPAHLGDAPAHHLAAEHGSADERYLHSAGLLYRRAQGDSPFPHLASRTALDWTQHILGEHPGCGAAAVVLSPSRCLIRPKAGAALAVHITPFREGSRLVHTDPAAVLSAVYAWLRERPDAPATLTAVVGGRAFRVRLSPPDEEEAEHLLESA